MSIPEGKTIITNVRITRQSDGAGYMMNDGRAAHEGMEEADILCCPHCQATVNLQAWRKERSEGGGGWCRKCAAPVCGPCLTRMLTHGCEPFIKSVDKALELAYRRTQNRKILGT
jgi:hypothetical protein